MSQQRSFLYSSSSSGGAMRGRRESTHPRQSSFPYIGPQGIPEHQVDRFYPYTNTYGMAPVGNTNHHQTTVYPYNRPEREIATSDPYAIRDDSKPRTPSVMRSPARPNLSPTPGVPTIPCGWDRCGIPLDDCSRSGIKRHLEDFHRYDIANAQRSACKWVEDGRPCQRDFSGIATLSKHIATVHLQSCKLRCPECGMWMSRPDALTRHRQASCQKSPLDDFCR